jgi:hypothetical protein
VLEAALVTLTLVAVVAVVELAHRRNVSRYRALKLLEGGRVTLGFVDESLRLRFAYEVDAVLLSISSRRRDAWIDVDVFDAVPEAPYPLLLSGLPGNGAPRLGRNAILRKTSFG